MTQKNTRFLQNSCFSTRNLSISAFLEIQAGMCAVIPTKIGTNFSNAGFL